MLKTLFPALFLLLLFTSCEKCYRCTTQQVITYVTNNPNTNAIFSEEYNTESEFCGKKKEMEEYQEEGTFEAEATDIIGPFRNTATRECVE